MEILTLKKKIREQTHDKTGRIYYDFIISGKSLFEILNKNTDKIGVFGWGVYEYQKVQIDEFLGQRKPELKSGRIPFYVCPECGDIDCGAITAEIEFNDNEVIWKNFGYENGYEDIIFDGYENVGFFTFDKIEYYKIIESLRK